MPVWHASLSVTTSQPGLATRRLHQPRRLERYAIDLLAGVGGTEEWWLVSPTRIAHLRVPLTAAENEQIPAWSGPIDDAGAEGRRRRRSLPTPPPAQ